MGEVVNWLLTENNALDSINSLEDDLKSTLSVIAYTHSWDYNFIIERQNWLKQKYGPLEQTGLMEFSPNLPPLDVLNEAYNTFTERLSIEYQECSSCSPKTNHFCHNSSNLVCAAKKRDEIKRECQELIESLYHYGDTFITGENKTT